MAKFGLFKLAILGLVTACEADLSQPVVQNDPDSTGFRIAPGGDVNDFLDCVEAEGRTLVSAHRGGTVDGLPENSLEAMKALLATTPAIMEIDVAASADGVLFLMHDDTLDRTTNGSGTANAQSWSSIKALRLKDRRGQLTQFSPPRFSDVLSWSAGRTMLQIDFKRSARYEDVVREIKDQNAEDRVVLIAYSLASAQKLNRLLPEAMISLSLNSQSDVNRAVASGIPANRILGFTGTESPRPRLFRLLDDRDIEVIFGTLGGRRSIDREISETGDTRRYSEIAATGVDIIATDRPRMANDALKAENRHIPPGICGVAGGSVD